jgi:chromosome segregation ATPase
MAAAAMNITDQGNETLAIADFQALEELERHSAELERQLAGRAEQSTRLESEIGHLQQERDHVRGRVERLLKHLDEFTA